MSQRERMVEVTVVIEAETEKAIRVHDGDPDKCVWLPLSQIEFERLKGNVVEVTLPEWLAQNKGLI